MQLTKQRENTKNPIRKEIGIYRNMCESHAGCGPGPLEVGAAGHGGCAEVGLANGGSRIRCVAPRVW
jgi:hypothetical protein